MKGAAEIAAKLTGAQRRGLIRFGEQFCMADYQDVRTLNALERRGLTGRYMRDSNFDVMVTITPLGLAVREHLMKEGGGA